MFGVKFSSQVNNLRELSTALCVSVSKESMNDYSPLEVSFLCCLKYFFFNQRHETVAQCQFIKEGELHGLLIWKDQKPVKPKEG